MQNGDKDNIFFVELATKKTHRLTASSTLLARMIQFVVIWQRMRTILVLWHWCLHLDGAIIDQVN